MTAKEYLHELVDDMSEAEAREWVDRVSGKAKRPDSESTAARMSNNADVLSKFKEWRKQDARPSGEKTPEFDPFNVPPVRFKKSLREMGLPEDGWD